MKRRDEPTQKSNMHIIRYAIYICTILWAQEHAERLAVLDAVLEAIFGIINIHLSESVMVKMRFC